MNIYTITAGGHTFRRTFPLPPLVGGYIRHAHAEWRIVAAVEIQPGQWAVAVEEKVNG